MWSINHFSSFSHILQLLLQNPNKWKKKFYSYFLHFIYTEIEFSILFLKKNFQISYLLKSNYLCGKLWIPAKVPFLQITGGIEFIISSSSFLYLIIIYYSAGKSLVSRILNFSGVNRQNVQKQIFKTFWNRNLLQICPYWKTNLIFL